MDLVSIQHFQPMFYVNTLIHMLALRATLRGVCIDCNTCARTLGELIIMIQ